MSRFFARYEAGIMLAIMIIVLVIAGSAILNHLNVFQSGWRTDFEQRSISLDDVTSGGLGRDGIMPVDDPIYATTGDVDWLMDSSPVIVVMIDGATRAYPLSLLMRHQIVNDTLNGQPIAVTFCPLCHSPVVYDRTVDGQTLRFGVSGNLYKSGVIMWDDVTESWWRQFTGEAVVGAYTGEKLDVLPSQVVGYGEYRRYYPGAEIVVGDQSRPDMVYGRNPYVGYDSNPEPFMFSDAPDDRYYATGRVLAAVINDQPIAFPFTLLAEQRVIHTEVDDVKLVIFWKPGAKSALDDPQINLAKDVGMAMMFNRTHDQQVLTFRYVDGMFVDDQTGSHWNIFGEAISGDLKGAKLHAMDCAPNFWFAWAAAHPDTRLYSAEG